VLRPLGDDLQPIEDGEGGAKPGETVVVVGLKHARTGDTLVLHKGPLHGWALPGVPVPSPVFSAAVVPAELSKAKALGDALALMARDDPSLVVGPDPEEPDTMVSLTPKRPRHQWWALLLKKR
jgi:translation elongation factor EF-G